MTIKAAHDKTGIRWTAPVVLAAMEEGQQRRWSARAYNGGPMRVDAPKLDAPLIVDLSGVTFAPSLVANLFHDDERIVGHVTEKQIASGVLDLAGVVSGGGVDAEHFIKAASDGFPWQASIEADNLRIEKLAAGKTAQVNGRTVTGPAYIAKRANVYGVAFLGRGADEGTSVTLAAGAADLFTGVDDMNYTEWLAALGFDDETKLTDAQKAKLKAKYDAETADALKAGHSKIDPPAFDLDGLKVEYAKLEADIEKFAFEAAGKVSPNVLSELKAGALQKGLALKATALQQEYAPQRFAIEAMPVVTDLRLGLIKAESPKGPAIHAGRQDVSPEVLQAAFARSAGMQKLESQFKPEVLEAADKTYRGIGLQEVILMAAADGGYTGRQKITVGNLAEVLRAAFSTHSLTTLLTTTGNKILLDGFMSIPQSWRQVAQVRTVNDFKTVTAFRLNASLEYEELGPGGEIKHGTATQETWTIAAKTYAKMMTLTRTDIINDDLGAFNDLRQRLGLGAAIKMNKLFWTAWLAAKNGAAFWTAARGNLVTGSALATAGLNTAVQAFRDMIGPDGNMMSLDPRFLLVPSALEATAKSLYVSTEYRDTTGSTKFVTANIHQGMFTPIVVPELGNSAYTGYSTTTWYLLADPNILASAAMCFLNGQQSPTIEQAEADFNVLGVQFRGYHDFGCAMTEYRASVQANA